MNNDTFCLSSYDPSKKIKFMEKKKYLKLLYSSQNTILNL